MSAPLVFRRLRVALLAVAGGWVALAVAALFVAPREWRAMDAAGSLLMATVLACAARRAQRAAELTERARGGAS